ncbi:hypothetical protein ES708_33901 [subsurface metagenome]
MLAGCHLMVGILNPNTHILQGQNGILPHLDGGVTGSHIEVASMVQRHGTIGVLEIEELQFRPHIKGIAQVGGMLQVSLEDKSRVALKRLTLRP